MEYSNIEGNKYGRGSISGYVDGFSGSGKYFSKIYVRYIGLWTEKSFSLMGENSFLCF